MENWWPITCWVTTGSCYTGFVGQLIDGKKIIFSAIIKHGIREDLDMYTAIQLDCKKVFFIVSKPSCASENKSFIS